jgi:polysaccharide chain length determinant protein (PEP-CTERM system associated)
VLPGKKYTPEDILRILWSRKWLLIVPFVVASVSTFVVARRLPSMYRSEALIQLIPQRISGEYVKSPVTTRIDERLTSIQQIVLSRSRLESIIKEFNLYAEARQTAVMEDVVERMRRADISIDVERGDAFRIRYVSSDPRTAQRVTAKLASLFIDENTVDVVHQSEQTSQFLDTKLEDAKRRLVEQERKLEAYKRSHAGQLPSELEANLQGIQTAQMQLQSLSESMNRDRDRKNLLDRQVADLLNDALTAVVPTTPVTPDGPQTGTTAQQLEAANAYLKTLLIRYKPDHPDVGMARRRVRDLEAQLQAETANRPADANANASTETKPTAPSELLKQNRLRDLRADIKALDQQLETKVAEERRLHTVIADYQARVAALPTRESELVELNRDYATLSAMYTNLLSKREESSIAADVVRQQIGEQFKLLDAARVPERPFSPDRARINFLGSMLGLAIGVALIGLLEYRDSTFKSEEDVVRVLELPVLALVPMMASERELRARRRRKLMAALVVAVMIVSSAAAVLIWRLQAS